MEVRSARKTRGSGTIDDPKPHTRPWTVDMPLRIALDTELIDGDVSREREVVEEDARAVTRQRGGRARNRATQPARPLATRSIDVGSGTVDGIGSGLVMVEGAT